MNARRRVAIEARRRLSRLSALVLAWSALAGSIGCARTPEAPPDRALATSGVRLDEGEVLPEWVALYDPERSWNGFTLALYRKQTPILIDMTGRLAHAWPEVRARSRVRLLEDCSLLTIASAGRTVQQYAWDGALVWEYALDERLPHHDLVRLANGNTLLVVLREQRKTDDLLEVDRSGRVVWEWSAGERLAEWLASRRPRGRANLTHINSVQELPDNPWFNAGDERFRPGNLLISARNLDALFVIDRDSGDVVWTLEAGLDQQHEALMNGPDRQRPGFVLLFNNNTFSARESAVQEVDPRDGSVVWEYRTEGFFSATKGAQQALPNGNVLIASSRGWRAFEVTRGGRTVWQWTPPFELQRPQRYAPDHCSELERLGAAAGPAIDPAPGYAHVDRELHELSDNKDQARVRSAGERRPVLGFSSRCRNVLLPPGATLELGYLVSPERAPGPGASARFTARLSAGGEESLIFDETVVVGAEPRVREIPLAGPVPRWVSICLAIEQDGVSVSSSSDRFAYWDRAQIVSLAEGRTPDGIDGPELTAEELEERRRHLRSMGYVD